MIEMKDKRNKKETTDMKASPKNYADIASRLIATKIFSEYVSVIEARMPIEPEGFVETRIINLVDRPTKKMKRIIWNHFMTLLLERNLKD